MVLSSSTTTTNRTSPPDNEGSGERSDMVASPQNADYSTLNDEDGHHQGDDVVSADGTNFYSALNGSVATTATTTIAAAATEMATNATPSFIHGPPLRPIHQPPSSIASGSNANASTERGVASSSSAIQLSPPTSSGSSANGGACGNNNSAILGTAANNLHHHHPLDPVSSLSSERVLNPLMEMALSASSGGESSAAEQVAAPSSWMPAAIVSSVGTTQNSNLVVHPTRQPTTTTSNRQPTIKDYSDLCRSPVEDHGATEESALSPVIELSPDSRAVEKQQQQHHHPMGATASSTMIQLALAGSSSQIANNLIVDNCPPHQPQHPAESCASSYSSDARITEISCPRIEATRSRQRQDEVDGSKFCNHNEETSIDNNHTDGRHANTDTDARRTPICHPAATSTDVGQIEGAGPSSQRLDYQQQQQRRGKPLVIVSDPSAAEFRNLKKQVNTTATASTFHHQQSRQQHKAGSTRGRRNSIFDPTISAASAPPDGIIKSTPLEQHPHDEPDFDFITQMLGALFLMTLIGFFSALDALMHCVQHETYALLDLVDDDNFQEAYQAVIHDKSDNTKCIHMFRRVVLPTFCVTTVLSVLGILFVRQHVREQQAKVTTASSTHGPAGAVALLSSETQTSGGLEVAAPTTRWRCFRCQCCSCCNCFAILYRQEHHVLLNVSLLCFVLMGIQTYNVASIMLIPRSLSWTLDYSGNVEWADDDNEGGSSGGGGGGGGQNPYQSLAAVDRYGHVGVNANLYYITWMSVGTALGAFYQVSTATFRSWRRAMKRRADAALLPRAGWKTYPNLGLGSGVQAAALWAESRNAWYQSLYRLRIRSGIWVAAFVTCLVIVASSQYVWSQVLWPLFVKRQQQLAEEAEAVDGDDDNDDHAGEDGEEGDYDSHEDAASAGNHFDPWSYLSVCQVVGEWHSSSSSSTSSFTYISNRHHSYSHFEQNPGALCRRTAGAWLSGVLAILLCLVAICMHWTARHVEHWHDPSNHDEDDDDDDDGAFNHRSVVSRRTNVWSQRTPSQASVLLEKVLVKHSIPLQSELLLSIILSMLLGVNAVYCSGVQGPAATVGNLYYASWIAFLLCVRICLGCVEECYDLAKHDHDTQHNEHHPDEPISAKQQHRQPENHSSGVAVDVTENDSPEGQPGKGKARWQRLELEHDSKQLKQPQAAYEAPTLSPPRLAAPSRRTCLEPPATCSVGTTSSASTVMASSSSPKQPYKTTEGAFDYQPADSAPLQVEGKDSLDANDSEETTTSDHSSSDTPEKGRLTRLRTYFFMSICSTVCLASSIDAASNQDIELTNVQRFMILTPLVVAVIAMIFFILCLSKRCYSWVSNFHVGGYVSFLCFGFWVSTLIESNHSEDSWAIDSIGEIKIANIYYFTWSSTLSSGFLAMSFVKSRWKMGSEDYMSLVWLAIVKIGFIMFISSGHIWRTIQGNCEFEEITLGAVTYCSRTVLSLIISLTGISVGSLILMVRVMMKLCACSRGGCCGRVMAHIELVISTFLALLFASAVAMITGIGGPGQSVGDLYYSTWLSFLVSLYILQSCRKQLAEEEEAKVNVAPLPPPTLEQQDESTTRAALPSLSHHNVTSLPHIHRGTANEANDTMDQVHGASQGRGPQSAFV